MKKNIIKTQDINILDENELEEFHELCLQVACLIKEEIQEEFEEENYYNERFEQIEIVLNKACDTANRLHKVNNRKIKIMLCGNINLGTKKMFKY